jgi:hypothetical protein
MALDVGVLSSKRAQRCHQDREGIQAIEGTRESEEPIVSGFLGLHRQEDSLCIHAADLVDQPFERESYISIYLISSICYILTCQRNTNPANKLEFEGYQATFRPCSSRTPFMAIFF